MTWYSPFLNIPDQWNDKSNWDKILLLLLGFLSFSFPLYLRLSPIIIILLIVFIVVDHLRGRYKSVLTIEKDYKSLFLYSSLFFFYCISLFFVKQEALDFGVLERKFSLLLFPVMLFTYGRIRKLKFDFLLDCFQIGVYLALIICTIFAVTRYIETKQVFQLIYTRFSLFTHPSYLSMYVLLVLVINMEKFKKERVSQSHYLIVHFLLLLAMVVIQSRAGMLLGVGFFLYQLFVLRNYRVVLVKYIMIALLFFSLSIYFVQYSKYTLNRFEAVAAQFNGKDENIRLKLWKIAAPIIQDNWVLGVNPYLMDDVLKVKYEQQNLKTALKNHYNVHNQYLHLWLCFGIVGLLVFCMMLLNLLIQSFMQRNILVLFFAVIIAVNAMFEVILNLQAGVVFYSFFNAIFVVHLTWQKDNSNWWVSTLSSER